MPAYLPTWGHTARHAADPAYLPACLSPPTHTTYIAPPPPSFRPYTFFAPQHARTARAWRAGANVATPHRSLHAHCRLRGAHDHAAASILAQAGATNCGCAARRVHAGSDVAGLHWAGRAGAAPSACPAAATGRNGMAGRASSGQQQRQGRGRKEVCDASRVFAFHLATARNYRKLACLPPFVAHFAPVTQHALRATFGAHGCVNDALHSTRHTTLRQLYHHSPGYPGSITSGLSITAYLCGATSSAVRCSGCQRALAHMGGLWRPTPT